MCVVVVGFRNLWLKAQAPPRWKVDHLAGSPGRAADPRLWGHSLLRGQLLCGCGGRGRPPLTAGGPTQGAPCTAVCAGQWQCATGGGGATRRAPRRQSPVGLRRPAAVLADSAAGRPTTGWAGLAGALGSVRPSGRRCRTEAHSQVASPTAHVVGPFQCRDGQNPSRRGCPFSRLRQQGFAGMGLRPPTRGAT